MEALAVLGPMMATAAEPIFAGALGSTGTTAANAALYAGQTAAPYLSAYTGLKSLLGQPQAQAGGAVAQSGVQPYQMPQFFPPQMAAPPLQPAQGGPMAGPMGPLIFDLRQYLPEWALPPGGY